MPIAAALIILASGMLWPVRDANAYTKTLRIGVEYNRAPFQYLNETGECVGLHIDLMDDIADENGWKVEYVPYFSYMDCVKALKNGDIDMILGVNTAYNYSDELTEGVELSDTFSSTVICMISSKDKASEWEDAEDYKNFVGAYEYDSVNYMYLSRWHLRKCYIVGNQVSLVQSLTEGDVDAIFGSYDSLTYLLENCYGNFAYSVVYSNITTMDYAVMVKESDSGTLQTINRTLAEMRSLGRYDEIYNQWIISSEAKTVKQVITVFVILASAVLAAFTASSVLNSLLKKKVREKTRELVVRMDQIGNESDFRNRIIEQSPGGMVYFERDYTVILANKVAKEICGWSGGDIVGRDIRDLKVFGEIIRRSGDDLFTPRRKEAELPAGVAELENRGEMRNYRYSFSLNYTMEQASGALLTVDDITVEEEEKREIIEAEKNKAMSRVVAGIAHEIKNPLMAIKLYSSMIRAEEGNREFYDSFSEKVPREVDRINSLVEALINYARPVRGCKERVDLAKLIDDSACLYSVAARDMGIKLTASAEKGLYIWANGDKIKQALINFITNGLESMEQKMKEAPCTKPLTLVLKAWRSGEMVSVSIYDEGEGMTSEEIGECSEPFYTTKARGTGLGLSLAKQFIGDNNGKMAIRSEKGRYTEIIMQFKGVAV